MAYGHELRLCAIQAYKKLGSLRRVSDVFSFHASTLCRWLKNGVNEKVRISPNAEKIRHEHVINFIRTYVQQNCHLTHSQLANAILETFSFKPSRQLVSRVLKQQHLVKVKIRPVRRPSSYKEPDYEARTKFRLLLGDPQTVCVDETCFQVYSMPQYGYTSRGQRLYRGYRSQRVCKRVCIAAISMTQPIHFQLSQGNTNGAVFADFIKSLSFASGTNIVMDNASIHKTNTVVQAAKEKGFNLHFIPPYSPDFNPIENVFGIAKQWFRKQNACKNPDQDEFNDIIQESFKRIPQSTFRKCYDHAIRVI